MLDNVVVNAVGDGLRLLLGVRGRGEGLGEPFKDEDLHFGLGLGVAGPVRHGFEQLAPLHHAEFGMIAPVVEPGDPTIL